MQTGWEQQLKDIRRKLSRQNEQWAQAKELVAASAGAIPMPSELMAELDRVCDVTVRPRHAPANFQYGAIRA
jgi:hypothetical protein